MSDLPSIVAAYAVVVGGVVAYAWSIDRRRSAARRVARALARHRDRSEPASPAALPLGRESTEGGR